MIVKKVPTSKHAAPKSKALNVRALADYIAGPRAGGDGEKVEHRGAVNLLNIDHEGQAQEMIDLAELAKRSPQPVQHWIMSWREGEQPTAAQADAAVGTFLDEMGLARHQAIYALHRNTHNWHLHLAVNRVDPETEKVVTVNNRFDHEVAHRAIARIEQRQGWQREDRALFLVRPNGDLERSQSRGQRGHQPSVGARDFEERAGARSDERIALEDAAPIIRKAQSWAELHKALAQHGMRFEKKGSGAILWIGDEPVKASCAGRDCSMSALQKKLGEFTHDTQQQYPERPHHRAPQPLDPDSKPWQQYIGEQARHATERAAVRDHMTEHQRDEWRRAAERHRSERAEVFSRSWKGQGALLNATRSVLAAEQAREKAALRDRQKLEREELRRAQRFPAFKTWLTERSPELAQEWRHRERQSAAIEGPAFEQPAPRDIRAFQAVVDGGRVHYHLSGERGRPAFTDRGQVIDIRDSRRRESVLAALQLSAQKWGTFTVHGSESFRHLCAELAAEHGFKIANPELQRAIADGRERLHHRAALLPSKDLSARSPADAYRLHVAEVARQAIPGAADPSRVDAEVAVRLRVMGYQPEVIVRTIRDSAPALRPHERRDWNDYARRAVDFAFSVPGSRLADELVRRNEQTLRTEVGYPERKVHPRGHGR
jgi:relaxase-like protein/conjugative element/phage-associated large polyvalent protein/DNA relaxase TraI-like protein/DNA primase RepB-like protein